MEQENITTTEQETIEPAKPKRKTLANCTAVEGFKQLNKIRKEFAAFYKLIGVSEIRAKYAKEAADTDKSTDGLAKGFIDEILDAALETDVEKSVEIVGMMAFLSRDESLALTIDDVYEIVTDCMESRTFMDFFSNAVNSALKGTENT